MSMSRSIGWYSKLEYRIDQLAIRNNIRPATMSTKTMYREIAISTTTAGIHCDEIKHFLTSRIVSHRHEIWARKTQIWLNSMTSHITLTRVYICSATTIHCEVIKHFFAPQILLLTIIKFGL